MDNNNWATLIELTLKKVKNGISKGTWQYQYQIDYDENTYWTFWGGKAVNGSCNVELGLSECSGSISAYSFVIRNENLDFQIIGEPYEGDESSTVIMHYLRILKDTQKDF